MNRTLMQAAAKIRPRVFLGGTYGDFEKLGRQQFILLLKHGLNPDSALLDIGCGCLRGGYWMIRFLNPGKYHGIEPNQEMLEAGIDEIVGPGVIQDKRPSFDGNDRYDFSVFGADKRYDFVMAGSIWTHAAKRDINTMMQQFASHSHPGSIMLASFVRAGNPNKDYRGTTWVGKSHRSDRAGLVQHDFGELEAMASRHRLRLSHLQPNCFGRISWLSMTRADHPDAD